MKIKKITLILSFVLAGLTSTAIAQTNDDDYQLVFSDEFDTADGSQPDSDKWVRSQRRSSTWNRWISDSEDVVYIENGCLVLRAIPNPDKESDPVDMLTGAVETRDKFAFTYGKVEVRIQVEPFRGSFPAAWMMPQPPAEQWPKGGEIDIFESIDAANTAYHTIHTNWTYNLGNRNKPQSSFSEYVNISQWHTYGLEWTDNQLTWTVDGRTVGTYKKSTNEEDLELGQWPFDHDFYLILNQSVGNGSWAANAITDHTYVSRVDYVRVYQKGANSIADNYNKNEKKVNGIYNLKGQKIADNNSSPAEKGIYIIDGKKTIVK